MAELKRPRSRQDQGPDDRLAITAKDARLAVELRRGVQQRFDLCGGVEVDWTTATLLQETAPTGGRVPGDVAVFEGDRQDPAQEADRLVDRGGC
jgi:hypothetical protein